MSGFRDQFGVARCCCNCEDCCNGSFPDEYDVELSFTNNDCTNCATYSTTYTLTKQGNCGWVYDSGFTLSDGCDPPYGTTIKRVVVNLTIHCISATHYRIALTWEVWRESAGCSGLYDTTSHLWVALVNHADYDCTTAADFELDWVSSSSNGWYYYYPFFRCIQYTPTDMCDPGAIAYITAVP